MSDYRYRVERIESGEDEWFTFLGSSRRIITVLSSNAISLPDGGYKYYITALVEEME